MYTQTNNTLYPPDTQNHGEAINIFSTEGLNVDIMNDDAKQMYVCTPIPIDRRYECISELFIN